MEHNPNSKESTMNDDFLTPYEDRCWEEYEASFEGSDDEDFDDREECTEYTDDYEEEE
jgi:hypothetical protein